MNNKKVLMLLAMTFALSASLTACNFGGGQTDESEVVKVTPTPEPTKKPKATPTVAPADAQNTTYTSKNKAVSIQLPDATWANKSDSDDMVSFESPDQGRILILHGSGDEAMSVAVIPSTQDTAVALEQADNLVQGTDFEIQDYTSTDTNGVSVYSYTVHYLNDKSEYEYVVNKYFTDNSTEFYSVAGSAKTADSLDKIKKSMDSFKISGDSVLKNAATGSASSTTAGNNAAATDGTATGTATDGSNAGTSASGTDGTAAGTSSDSSSGSYDGSADSSAGYDNSSSTDSSYSGSSDDSSSYDYDDGSSNGYYADGTPVGTDDPDYDTNQTRTIYRNSDGYPLVIYPNGDGTWYDDDGNTYDFANGEDVYDENGTDYYYHGEPAYVRYMPKQQ